MTARTNRTDGGADMSDIEQETRKGPRPFTQEELEAFKAYKEEHKKKLQTDPEYKALWERKTLIFRKYGLFNDDLSDE